MAFLTCSSFLFSSALPLLWDSEASRQNTDAVISLGEIPQEQTLWNSLSRCVNARAGKAPRGIMEQPRRTCISSQHYHQPSKWPGAVHLLFVQGTWSVRARDCMEVLSFQTP